MDQSELRKKIIEINKLNISSIEKQTKIQELFNSNYSNILDKKTTKKTIDNCTHYKNRKCMILASCCNKYYQCRICHDNSEDHKIDRFKTEFIVCKICDQKQECSNTCISCNINFGDYYCGICHLWITKEGEENPAVYHCDKCNICRKGNKEDYFHCDKCNLCLTKTLEKNHNCVENTLESVCCICKETIIDSVKNISVLNCGHCIHSICLEKWCKENYKCPLCKKSISDMKNYWSEIDNFLENQKMPEDFKDKECNILCNDCNTKSIAKYHFIYNKCGHCKGYNTNLINII